ncbi:hypothetical protein E3N88_00526 [Mikania micrantha]|uniref:Uncharacterized protein n=1 Tax=Mikania micrantha TaxID=192012 RepID=A0A5N6Q115_9ASTR|nr:hypothetical protein E3N88_00526 [Mikania micrantha]
MVEYESPKKGQDLFLDKKVPTKDGLDKLHHLRELGVALFLITNQKELMNWITNLRDLRSSSMTLWMLKELESFVEDGLMQCLKHLEIRCCGKLNYIPTTLLQPRCLTEKGVSSFWLNAMKNNEILAEEWGSRGARPLRGTRGRAPGGGLAGKILAQKNLDSLAVEATPDRLTRDWAFDTFGVVSPTISGNFSLYDNSVYSDPAQLVFEPRSWFAIKNCDHTSSSDIDSSHESVKREHNVRVIPGLNRKLISVGQLDKQGMEERFGSNEWKVVKGNLVIARGMKHGSLYLVDEPAKGCMTVPVKRNKIWFAKSRAKRVHFANVKSGAKEMLAERVQKSKPFRGFGDSGSKGCAPGTVTKSRWVLKTRTEEFYPVGSLLCLESVGGPRCISGFGEVSIPVETEDESLTGFVTTELELRGASTGPSFVEGKGVSIGVGFGSCEGGLCRQRPAWFKPKWFGRRFSWKNTCVVQRRPEWLRRTCVEQAVE